MQEVAPAELLQIISCRCIKGCGNRCGCRKFRLQCSEICYHCHGQSCSNAKNTGETQEDADDTRSDSDDDEYNAFVQRLYAQTDKYGHPLDKCLKNLNNDDFSDEESNIAISEQSIVLEENCIDNAEEELTDDRGPFTSKKPRVA